MSHAKALPLSRERFIHPRNSDKRNEHHVRIDILTVVPELLESPLKHSIIGRAQREGFLELYVHNIRDYSTNKWRRVDDYPFGGEAGMVLQIEPIDRAISDLRAQRDYDEVIYTSPGGKAFGRTSSSSVVTTRVSTTASESTSSPGRSPSGTMS